MGNIKDNDKSDKHQRSPDPDKPDTRISIDLKRRGSGIEFIDPETVFPQLVAVKFRTITPGPRYDQFLLHL